MLFWTKVGPYTQEEFEQAVETFNSVGRPFVFTYFKTAPIGMEVDKRDDLGRSDD
jgi:hypothetical protein